jgi:hypothetical protein
MSTGLFDQYATLDPAGTPEALPDWTSTAPVLLAEIDERTHPMQTKHHSAKANDSERRWTGVLVAAAAFAVVMILGVSLSLLNRGGDSPDVIAPVITTTPTSVPDATPTTIPAATPPVVPDETTPVVVTVPSESAAPGPIDEISGVAVADGSLWVSTGEGIVRWDLEGGDPDLFTPDDGVPMIEGFSPAITVAPDGTVWAYAFYPQDLVAFDGTRWSEPVGYDQIDALNPRCSPDDECPNPITAMAAGPNGVLFLALGDGALVEFDGVVWHVLPDTPVSHAADMAVAADGTLWVASWEDVLAHDGDTWTQFTTADGLPSGGISSVAVAPNGDVWVGATDVFDGEASSGLARFDGDAWTVFDETDGLYDNSVTALAVGPGGTVWTVHSSADSPGAVRELATGGVSRFDGETWSATAITDVGAGFGSGGAAVDDAGMLWIASDRGVVGFDGAEATVLRAREGVRPEIEVPHVVVEGGEDILATTLAKPTAPVATCPTGTDPNRSGPVDQARPLPGYGAAMDRQSGRVVATDDTSTWAFDVCTNTWTRMLGPDSSRPYNPSAFVYDADSDLVVAIGTAVAVYDVDTDTWERHGETPLDNGPETDSEARAIYDPVSGLIVVRDIWSSEMWAYDVDTDTWTPIEQGPISPPGVGEPIDSRGYNFYAQHHAYDASTDRIVLYLSDNYSNPGVWWDGAGTEMTWTFDLRAGEWTIEDTVTPEFGVGGFSSPTGKAAYDEAVQRTVITGDGVVGGYDAARHEWEILWANPGEPDADGIGTGLHDRFVVYDPTNDRVVVIGGEARMPDGDPFWVTMNDVWAFDTGAGTWTELLASLDQ